MAGDTIVPLSGNRVALEYRQSIDSDPPCHENSSGDPKRDLERAILAEDSIIEEDSRHPDEGDTCIVSEL